MSSQISTPSPAIGIPGYLFDSLPAFLPVIESSETLYSWAGRYHRRSGNARIQESSLVLFGDPLAGLHHDFPSHVSRLAQCLGISDCGTQLLLDHTVFGVVAKFLDPETVRTALSMMLGPSVAGLRHRLGLLKSGVGAVYPLKACWKCIAADMLTPSGPMWHLEHQWPSVWICREHSMPLSYVVPRRGRGDSRWWLLPDSVEGDEWLQLPRLSDRQFVRLQRLAVITAAIAAMGEIHYDLMNLRLTYLLASKGRGFIVTSDGSTRFSQLVEAIRETYADLESLPGWGFLADTKAPHGGFIGLLLRRYPGNRHLNKHVILIDFLFDSYEEFSLGYGTVAAAENAGTIDELAGELCSTRQQVLHQVSVGGSSINQAAKNAGVAASQAVKWVRDAGIAYRTRPRVLDQERRVKLLKLLGAGRTRDQIIEQLGVKKSWLRSFLASNAEVRYRWRAMQDHARREQYRRHFLMLLERHAGTPVKRIKAIPGSGFSWLYNHDREWLISNLPRVR